MTRIDLVERMAQAIAVMEGYPKLTSLAAKNNNPGNLRSWGKTPVVKGYAKFPSPEEGWRALRVQIGKMIDRKLNLYEVFGGKPNVYSGYAPSSDGNYPRHYAEFVAQRVGIEPSVVLEEVIE